MTTTQIAINTNDQIELFSGSNDWSLDAKVIDINAEFVYIQVRDVRGQIERALVESDDFGKLSAPRHRVQALPSEGQTIHSARGGDTHGCRDGWTAKVYTTDSKTVTAMIIANQHCYSCWQTGCVDDGQVDNDCVGKIIEINHEWCEIDQHGQIVVNQTIS